MAHPVPVEKKVCVGRVVHLSGMRVLLLVLVASVEEGVVVGLAGDGEVVVGWGCPSCGKLDVSAPLFWCRSHVSRYMGRWTGLGMAGLESLR